jgi:hypothetical protein
MKDRVKDKKRRERRSYSKPELRFIDLVAEEVLAVGCKMNGFSSMAAPCNANNCVSTGS